MGHQLRRILLAQTLDPQAELLLYMADRAQHVAQVITPYLNQGALVLCDRYIDSTLAYQGYGRGIPPRVIRSLNRFATRGRLPDLTLWLDLPVEQGLARVGNRGSLDQMEQASIEFHRAVYQGFADLARAQPERVVVVNAQGSVAQVAQRIQGVLSTWLDHQLLKH